MSESKAPYTSLGSHLKYVREQARQSLAEVSGAVEIEEGYLERIEAGLERPAEEVLLLLISYLGVKDHEAIQLWESAEYETELPEEIRPDTDLSQLGGKPLVMLLTNDNRTVYSDGVEVMANPAGVTLNFTHSYKGAATSVGRVGMSQQQAEQVVAALQKALLRSKYNGDTKLLPPSVSNK